MVYDRFRLVSLPARETLRAGYRLDPSAVPAELLAPRVIVLGFARSPLSGEDVPPRSVQINGKSGRQITIDEARKMLPGVSIPPLTVVAVFSRPGLRPPDRISIVFNEQIDARRASGRA